MVNENFTPTGSCEEVLDVLKAGRGNPLYIATVTGIDTTTVEYWLRRLTDAGWVSKPVRGLYEFEGDPRINGDHNPAGEREEAVVVAETTASERGPATVDRLQYQFVWSTTGYTPLLTGEIPTRLETLLNEHADDLDGTIRALTIRPTYVHLSIEAPPALAPQAVVEHLKTHSARRLQEDDAVEADFTRSATGEGEGKATLDPATDTDDRSGVWSESYFISSDAEVSDDTVDAYLDAQGRRG